MGKLLVLNVPSYTSLEDVRRCVTTSHKTLSFRHVGRASRCAVACLLMMMLHYRQNDLLCLLVSWVKNHEEFIRLNCLVEARAFLSVYCYVI